MRMHLQDVQAGLGAVRSSGLVLPQGEVEVTLRLADVSTSSDLDLTLPYLKAG